MTLTPPGTRSQARLRNQQEERLQTLSDDYLGCLHNQDVIEKDLTSCQGKMGAIVWEQQDLEWSYVKDSPIFKVRDDPRKCGAS